MRHICQSAAVIPVKGWLPIILRMAAAGAISETVVSVRYFAGEAAGSAAETAVDVSYFAGAAAGSASETVVVTDAVFIVSGVCPELAVKGDADLAIV